MTSIAERIAAVHARIEAARLQAQLPQGAVALLAVSKTFGPEAVCAAMATGQQDFGENYVQEGVAKQQAVIRALEAYPMPAAAALPGSGLLRPGAQGPRWHFIGPLQSNKTRDVAEHFDWVHTIDRVKIAQRLADQRPETLNPLQVCIQVNIDREPTKSGVDPDAIIATSLAIAKIAADTGRIQLRGLMAIPLPATQPDQQRAAFGRLRGLLKSVNETFQAQAAPKTPLLDTLSMGMSDDLESAIAESDPDITTWVRIGSAIFGSRPKPTA